MRPCALPGCPVLLDSVSLAQYCPDHDELNLDLSSDFEDEARGALDKFLEIALAEIEWFKKSREHSFDALAAEHIIVHAPEVVRTAEAGETWTAVRHALWVGMWIGHSNEFHTRSEKRRLEPLAKIGRKVKGGNPNGRPLNSDISAEELWRAMSDEKSAVARKMYDSEAARLVIARLRLPLSERQVMARTQPFRSPPK